MRAYIVGIEVIPGQGRVEIKLVGPTPLAGARVGESVEILRNTAFEESRPSKIKRDELLAEISRSLHATHPEIADELAHRIEIGLRAQCGKCGGWIHDELGCEGCNAKEEAEYNAAHPTTRSIETGVDEAGTIIFEAPYAFRSVSAPGEIFIHESASYEVISSERTADDRVRTVLRRIPEDPPDRS